MRHNLILPAVLLLVLASCAAPPNVGRIEEKNATNVSAATPATETPAQDLNVTPEDDELEREIKEMLQESNVIEEKPAVAPKKTNTTTGKPGGLAAVKGTIELAKKSSATNEPEVRSDGSIIVESKKGFKGEPTYPKGTINLKLTNKSQPIGSSGSSSSSGPSPYEALLNATRAQDNQTRR
ncbi:hypothetical protein HY641_04335 [Candidatus Woesearchaeota archaeon]|nr:hypothetical protein [Candidatus Woesearchaeota archaeon]